LKFYLKRKKDKMNKISLIIVTMLLGSVVVAENDEEKSRLEIKHAYYTVGVDRLNIREKPDLQSKVLTVLNYCDRVELLEETNIIVKVVDSNGEIDGPMYKIKTSDNLIGYAFGYYLTVVENIPFSMNKEEFDIRGSWASNIDPPTEIISFLKNNNFECKRVVYDKDPEVSKGTYTYDGFSKIIVNYKKKKRIFNVVVVNGKKTLKENCFIYDPEFFQKMK
jgi:hypothetical protein